MIRTESTHFVTSYRVLNEVYFKRFIRKFAFYTKQLWLELYLALLKYVIVSWHAS